MKKIAIYAFSCIVAAAILVAFAWFAATVTHRGASRSVLPIEMTPAGPVSSEQAQTIPRPAEPDATTTLMELEKPRMIRDPKPLPGETAVRVPILMYHYVRPITPNLSRSQRLLSITPEHFDAQMQQIVDGGWHTISPADLYAALNDGAKLPSKPVMITFDDGYRGQYTYAYPSLTKRNLRATFFVISTYTAYSGYMLPSMLKEMDASGLMTIASHTRHHAPLTKIVPAAQESEIKGSKDDLEKELGHPVDYFAYPYGYVNDTVKQLTTSAGYLLGFSTLPGSLHTSSSRMELRRIRIQDGQDLGPVLERFSK